MDSAPQIPLPAQADSSKTPGVQTNCLKPIVVLACVFGLMTSLAAGQPRPPAPGKGATVLSTGAAKKTSARPALTGKPVSSIPSGATLLQESSRPSRAAAAGAKPVKAAPTAPGMVRVAPQSAPPRVVKAKKVQPAPQPVATKVKPAPQPATAVVKSKPTPAASSPQPKAVAKKAPAPANAKKSTAAAIAPAPAAPQTKAEKLAELTELYRNDKISPKEFHSRRERLLSE